MLAGTANTKGLSLIDQKRLAVKLIRTSFMMTQYMKNGFLCQEEWTEEEWTEEWTIRLVSSLVNINNFILEG